MFRCPHCGKSIPEGLVAAQTGRRGGRRTAKRGSAYFRRIAGMRKHRRGGRPKKARFKPKLIDMTERDPDRCFVHTAAREPEGELTPH